MSIPSPDTTPAPRWFAWFAAVALLGYAFFLGFYFSPFAGGSDTSGYLNAAQLLTEGRLTAPQRDFAGLTVSTATQLQPLGFIAEPERARLIPTYPLGLPAHLALAGLCFGWTAAPIVVGLGALVVAMVLCYGVALDLRLSWPFAAAGAVMFGAFPVTIFASIQPLSDVLATTWVLAAIFAAFRAPGSLQWAIATGVALAIAGLVRPTNLLVLPALVVLIGLRWRPLVAAALGGLPGALLLLGCNTHLFGSPWRMGYGPVQEAFATGYFWPTVLHFASWLALLMPAVLLVLPFGALRLVRARPREIFALALWFFVPVLVYAFYEFSHETWWYLRFLLPACPALILAALLGLERGLPARPRLLAFTAVALSAWAVGLGAYRTATLHTLFIKSYEKAYADTGQWAAKNLPASTVLLANADSGALYRYTPFPVLRWDQMGPAEFSAHAAHFVRASRPLYLVTFTAEEDLVLGERVPARWEKITQIANRSIWRYAGPAP